MNAAYKICPRCQTVCLFGATFCHHCSRQFRSTAPIVQLTVVIGCPMCGNRATQKVAAIYRGGSWNQQSVGESVGYATDFQGHGAIIMGETVTQTSGATQLAQMLAPPQAPWFDERRERVSQYISYALCGFFLVVFVGLLNENVGASTLSGLVFVGTFALAIYTTIQTNLAIKNGREDTDQARAIHGRQMKDWEQLDYCPQCDHVSHPASHHVARAQSYRSLLS